VAMNLKTETFSHFSSQTKVWMPSTWAISYTINLLKLWFRLISKITLFLLFHIPTPNIFNYKRLLQDFGIDDLKAKPPDFSCHNSPFKYSSVGRVFTGDMIIIDDEYLRKILV
jgi:hypothetical protein